MLLDRDYCRILGLGVQAQSRRAPKYGVVGFNVPLSTSWVIWRTILWVHNKSKPKLQFLDLLRTCCTAHSMIDQDILRKPPQRNRRIASKNFHFSHGHIRALLSVPVRLTLELSSCRVKDTLGHTSMPAYSVDSELLRYFPDHADAFQILLYSVDPILLWSCRLSL